MQLPHVLTVRRLAASGANKDTYQDRPGTIACFLQPLELEESDQGNQSFGRVWRCYIAYASDVRLKDNVTIDGKVYRVRGMREHQYGGFPHKALTLEAANE